MGIDAFHPHPRQITSSDSQVSAKKDYEHWSLAANIEGFFSCSYNLASNFDSGPLGFVANVGRLLVSRVTRDPDQSPPKCTERPEILINLRCLCRTTCRKPKGRRRICCVRRLTTTLIKGSVTLTEVKGAVRYLMPSTNGFFAAYCAQSELKSLSLYWCNILIYTIFQYTKGAYTNGIPVRARPWILQSSGMGQVSTFARVG